MWKKKAHIEIKCFQFRQQQLGTFQISPHFKRKHCGYNYLEKAPKNQQILKLIQ